MIKDWLASYGKFILRAFDFKSRATPIEYWSIFPLVWGLILFALLKDITSVQDALLAQQTVSLNPFTYFSFILYFITIIPRMSLNIRRLHDRGRNAMWLFFPFAFSLGLPALLIALTGAMMNSSLTGVANAPDALSNVIYPITLYMQSPVAFWEEMFAIARAFHSAGTDALWGLLAEIHAHSGKVDVRREADDLQNEIAGSSTYILGVVAAVFCLVILPPLSAMTHAIMSVFPTLPFDNEYGPAKQGQLQYAKKPQEVSNALAGYAHLYGQTEEEKEHNQAQRAAELKDLYRQRVLGVQA